MIATIASRVLRIILILSLTGAATHAGLPIITVLVSSPVVAQAPPAPVPGASTGAAPEASEKKHKPGKPQTRPHGTRIAVDPRQVVVDDGDTIEIRWSADDVEEVRILGIDCPETRHLPHNIPFAQPFGDEARAFALGAFATAKKVELLRAATLDPYDRTLAYAFVDGKNYSVLVLDARLAEESVTAFGDNGFPKEAASVMEAAKRAGPLPFEPPFQYRNRMRRLAEWMKGKGIYPSQ